MKKKRNYDVKIGEKDFRTAPWFAENRVQPELRKCNPVGFRYSERPGTAASSQIVSLCSSDDFNTSFAKSL